MMITNQRQLRITKSALGRLESARQGLLTGECPEDVHPRIYQAMIDALESQIDTLRRDVRRYERLRSGRVKTTRIDGLEDVARALVEARVVAGLTQAQLGAKLGVAAQQIQRYEASMYRGASLERLSAIAGILGLEFPRRLRFRKRRRRGTRTASKA